MKEQKRTIYNAGSYIYIEGDEEVDNVYIVEKGLVNFKSSTQRVLSHGSSAGAGDVFGAISALSKRPRMETAFAKINTSVIIFTREKFLSVLQKNSEIAIKLLNSFADELRLYDTLIFSLQGKQKVFLPEDIQLFTLGRYYFKENMFATAFYILKKYCELYPNGSNIKEARLKLDQIQKRGISKVAGPVRDGIYQRYADKQIIFCEHEPGTELFIIKKGKVKIIKYHDNSEIILSVLNEGEIFGELAIVSDKPRNATAISYGSTILLPINKDSLMKLIQKSSDILKRIFTAISQRVWFTFIRMEAKLYEKPITRVYVFLENKLIEDNISLKSHDPHSFYFGIDELIKMANIPIDKIAAIMEDLMKDQNLEFNLGQTIILDPSITSSKARFYRSRDHLFEGAEKHEINNELPKQPSLPTSSQSNKKDAAPEMKRKTVRNHTEVSSKLFDELEDEINKLK